jgi:hypothetical protein
MEIHVYGREHGRIVLCVHNAVSWQDAWDAIKKAEFTIIDWEEDKKIESKDGSSRLFYFKRNLPKRKK